MTVAEAAPVTLWMSLAVRRLQADPDAPPAAGGAEAVDAAADGAIDAVAAAAGGTEAVSGAVAPDDEHAPAMAGTRMIPSHPPRRRPRHACGVG
jgi:hypothetical protein